jgi:MBOAT membrane-bound O-acyltransferase family protein
VSEIENRWRMSLATILAVLAFRALPFVAFALASRAVSARGKLFAVCGFGVLVAACARLDAPLRDLVVVTPLALAYFALVALLAHRLARVARASSVQRMALFAIFWLLGVVLPGCVLSDPLASTLILIGWNVALSAYSYCVDTSALEERPSASECVFFVVVNPLLVYAERGAPDPRAQRSVDGCARVTLGCLAWLAQDALGAGAAFFDGALARSLALRGVELSLPLASAIALLARYFAQSGLASIQIGFMTLAGYRVPECYVHPWIARSPLEFWQRWNTWVGSWLRRYVFLPTSLALRRRHRAWPASAITVAGVLVTFVSVGLLHDFPLLIVHAREPFIAWPQPKMTLFFALSALVLLTWIGIARLFAGTRLRRSAARIPEGLRAAIAVLSVLDSMLLVHACATWLSERPVASDHLAAYVHEIGERSDGAGDEHAFRLARAPR